MKEIPIAAAIRDAAAAVDEGAGVFARLGPCGWGGGRGAGALTPADVPPQLLARNERVAYVLERFCVPDDYPFDLFIRPWRVMDPACELRLFVRDGVLEAVSQRHIGQPLGEQIDAAALLSDAVSHLVRIARWLPGPSVIVDLVPTPSGAKLVDLAPFTADTGAGLFASTGALTPEFRFLDGGAMLRVPLRRLRLRRLRLRRP